METLQELGEAVAIRRKALGFTQSTVAETPEMLAAIDEGRRAIGDGKIVNIEEMRRRVGQWTTQ